MATEPALTAHRVVVIVNGEQMGRGDDGLGAKLQGNFFRTLVGIEPKPDTIVFYNSAVRLLAPDSVSLEALKQLADSGVDLLACVTCLEFYALTEKIAVGFVSNMREITQRMLSAAKVITL